MYHVIEALSSGSASRASIYSFTKFTHDPNERSTTSSKQIGKKRHRSVKLGRCKTRKQIRLAKWRSIHRGRTGKIV